MSVPRVDIANGVRLTPVSVDTFESPTDLRGVALIGHSAEQMEAIENNEAKPDGDNPAMPGVLSFANSPDLRHRG
jgi:hypothetical protein